MDRKLFLLKKVAEYLKNGMIPFTVEFLYEFNVTMDECYELSTFTADAIETFLMIVEPK